MVKQDWKGAVRDTAADDTVFFNLDTLRNKVSHSQLTLQYNKFPTRERQELEKKNGKG